MGRTSNGLVVAVMALFVMVIAGIVSVNVRMNNLEDDLGLVCQSAIERDNAQDKVWAESFELYTNKTNKALGDFNSHLLMRLHAQMELLKGLDERLDKVPSNLLPKLVKQLTPSVVKIKVNVGYDEYSGRTRGWSGSGVFIAEDLILTAGHVVNVYEIKKDVDPEYLYKVGYPITVELVNGTELEVVDVYMEKVGITDLGLIKVKLPDIHIQVVGFEPLKSKPLPFGTAEVGERVFAIGEPFGLFPTVTSGIVSALDVGFEDDFFGEADMLQTDCPINPGTSGCPLFNMKGEVIAIVVGSFGVVQQNSGVNFCVPAKICQLVIAKYLAICALEESANE
jgi:S1-C subfamily serine protease